MNAHNEQHDPASAVVKQNLTTQPAAAQESAPWRDHDAAIDAKALSTATEIALMWGQDRSQFISRIQVAVIDAMRWVKGGLQPAAAQEAVVWQWRNLRAETGWKDCTRAVYDVFRQNGLNYEVRKLYAAPVTAAPEASYFEYLDRYNHSLRRAIHAMMAKLVFLLDEDQFADIEAIALAAGVTPAAPGIDLREIGGVMAEAEKHVETLHSLCPRASVFECIKRLRKAQAALIDASPKGATLNEQFGSAKGLDSPKGGSEADDAALLNWMDANGFTAYRSVDPIDGISGHCVVVHETMAPRRGNVHDTIRGAIRAAMKAQAGDAEVRP